MNKQPDAHLVEISVVTQAEDQPRTSPIRPCVLVEAVLFKNKLKLSPCCYENANKAPLQLREIRRVEVPIMKLISNRARQIGTWGTEKEKSAFIS